MYTAIKLKCNNLCKLSNIVPDIAQGVKIECLFLLYSVYESFIPATGTEPSS